jgi:hypothetical protein
VKADSLTGSVIDESTLTIVPSAQNATSATTAGSANTAKSATTAQSAATAKSADNADTVEGLSAEDLIVACPAATVLFGGMCWDADNRPLKNWIAASIDCGKAGGRLPSLSELIAYVDQEGPPVIGEIWTGDVSELDPDPEGDEIVLTRSENATSSARSQSLDLGYRCLFYRVN